MLTTILSRSDVARHVNALHLLKELRTQLTARAPRATSAGETATVLECPDFPAWAVRTQRGERTVLQLHDAATGGVLAVMEASRLLTLRASLVSALACDVLARADARNVAVLGSGPAPIGALMALRLVRSIEHVWLYEPDLAGNFARARALATSQHMAVHAADSVKEAVADADVVLLYGDAPEEGLALRPGAHLSLPEALPSHRAPLAQPASGFCDATAPLPGWRASFTPLSQVLTGARPGRNDTEALTCFAALGSPELDLVTAWHVFEGARHDETLARVDLES